MEQLSSPYFLHFILQNFNINNSLFSVLIILFCPILFKYIIDDFSFSNLHNFSFNNLFYFFRPYKSEIRLKGNITEVQKFQITSKFTFSSSLKSLLWYIQKIISENKINVNKIEEFNLEENKTYNQVTDNYEEELEFSWLMSNDIKVKLNDDIFCYIYKTTNIKGENPVVKTICINLYIYSYTKNYDHLLNFINDIKILYENEDIRFQNNDTNLYIISNQTNNDDNSQLIEYNKIIFNSNKKYENIFFKEKKCFFNEIDFFINNSKWYKDKGIPYTFGILLYGKPGTGKTSLIKALSNYTNRHILNINLKTIETSTQFKEIFLTKKFCRINIPSNKIIIIIEDIDCLNDVITNRNKKKTKIKGNWEDFKKLCVDTTTDNNNDNNDNSDTGNSNKDENILIDTKKNNDKLTLSHILNIIDGCYERNGSILIITSNHPEKIDPALIRPGRIDMCINLNYISIENSIEMFCFFFDLNKQQFKKLPKINFINHKISPAFLQNILKFNKYNINDCIQNINKIIYKEEIINELSHLNNSKNIPIDINISQIQKIYFDFILQKNSYNLKFILLELNDL